MLVWTEGSWLRRLRRMATVWKLERYARYGARFLADLVQRMRFRPMGSAFWSQL